jgi:hypothetical protein
MYTVRLVPEQDLAYSPIAIAIRMVRSENDLNPRRPNIFSRITDTKLR